MSGNHHDGSDYTAASKQLWPGCLAPVGEPMVPCKSAPERKPRLAPGYRSLFLNSGTAALSLAMSLAGQKRGCPQGEVIVPGYGCPDLLAAAHYAGLHPILVDIQPDSPRYEPAVLEAAFTVNTVAVVAVNFMGIPEDLAALRLLCDVHGVCLIEDNAQFFPLDPTTAQYTGELVVHSFGRGKPISLLGGGVLLASGDYGAMLDRQTERLSLEHTNPVVWRSKARLFNLVLRPRLYQLLLLMPFLDIGKTEYKPLEGIALMDEWRADCLAINAECYRQRERKVQLQYDAIFAEQEEKGLVNLPRQFGALGGPLLRYPFLCIDRERRDALYRELEASKVGATVMYGRPLNNIESLPTQIQGLFPGASQFAGRLLTLPVNSFVRASHLQTIERVFSTLP